MYYETNNSGEKIRPLPGYFDDFKSDLANADPSVLSDMQRDYLGIPDERIVMVPDEEHRLIQCRKIAVAELSRQCKTERKLILDDTRTINVLTGATKGYPEYLTGEVGKNNIAALNEKYRSIYHDTVVLLESAQSVQEIASVMNSLQFPTEAEIMAEIPGAGA